MTSPPLTQDRIGHLPHDRLNLTMAAVMLGMMHVVGKEPRLPFIRCQAQCAGLSFQNPRPCGLARTGQTDHQVQQGQVSERLLQMHDIVPAIEFETNRLVVSDAFEAEFLVNGNGVGGIGCDDGKHLLEPMIPGLRQ